MTATMDIPADKLDLWKKLFGDVSPALLRSFKAFHQENSHVFRAFKRRAEEIRSTGRSRYSHWAIINVVRWDMDIQTSGKDFRISNDHIAIFARLLVWDDPTFDGFFDLKQMKPTRGCKMNTKET